MNAPTRINSALNVRDEFPGVGDWHYLDSAATAQKPQAVIDAIAQAYGPDYATVHRGIYRRSSDMLVAPIGWKAVAMFSRPWPNTVSTPGAPRSSADLNRMSTICLPVRFGKACAMSATAPAMIGAEKLVPDQLESCPFWSIVRTFVPSVIRVQLAPEPARLEKLAMFVEVEFRAPAMITWPGNVCAGISAKGSEFAPRTGSVPSLPAEITRMTP